MRFWFLGLLVASGIVATVSGISRASAAEVTSLYTAQVPFDQQRSDARESAYNVALQQVLLRVSGPELVDDPGLYDALFPNPSTYVVQFQPGPDDTLYVTFDGMAIEKKLRDSNQTVWGGDRPLTLVWLAVDWGQGERGILGAVDAVQNEVDPQAAERNRQLREHLLEVAGQRGLPIAFPLLDSEDLANVEFSDIWGGFDDRVVAGSERYDANSILIGRMSASGAAQNRWTYLFGDQQRHWTGQPATVVAQVSDLLSQEFAISGSEPVREVELSIHGVTSVDAYGDVQNMLANVNVIDSFTLAEVAGDGLRYHVRARGGASRLARALRFEGLLEEDRVDTPGFDVGDDSIDSLAFYYNP